jgi:hypothetical protein
MAYEDFTAGNWTESDPQGEITVAANAVTVANRAEDVDGWVYGDYGAAHFGLAFVHEIKITHDSLSGDTSRDIFWGVSNVIDDARAWADNDDQVVHCKVYDNGGSPFFQLVDRENDDSDNSVGVSSDTAYWLKITRSGVHGETLTVQIYDDAAKTSLVDTIAVTLTNDRTYRYVFASNTYKTGSTGNAGKVYSVCENLDLNEGGATTTTTEPPTTTTQPPTTTTTPTPTTTTLPPTTTTTQTPTTTTLPPTTTTTSGTSTTTGVPTTTTPAPAGPGFSAMKVAPLLAAITEAPVLAVTKAAPKLRTNTG